MIKSFPKTISNIEKSITDLLLILLAVLAFILFLQTALFSRTPLIPQGSLYISHILLWLVMFSSMYASKEDKHLVIIDLKTILPTPFKKIAHLGMGLLSTAVLFAVAISTIFFIKQSILFDAKIGIFNQTFLLSVIPFAFIVMGIRSIKMKGEFNYSHKTKVIYYTLASLLGIFLSGTAILDYIQYGLYFSKEEYLIFFPAILKPLAGLEVDIVLYLQNQEWLIKLSETLISLLNSTHYTLILLFVIAAFFKMPLFVVLGGIAYVLFLKSQLPLALPNQIYTMLTEQATSVLPALPLFTLTGYLLSESSSGKRLVQLFNVYLAQIPSGIILSTLLVCAFFTSFSGASGLTILALGGLLIVPLREYYNDKFNYGLLTSSGSIGLLFPPSLPLLMYAIYAVQADSSISFPQLLVAGVIPGIIIIALLLVLIVLFFPPPKKIDISYSRQEKLKASAKALPEFLLPMIILVTYFFVTSNLVYVSAITLFYVFIIIWLRKDFTHNPVSIVQKSLPVVGGIFMILAMSKGLSDYFIDQGIPQALKTMVQENVSSKYVFLLLLNLSLLVVGSFMDIFSAIIVIVPLLIPLAEVYDISLIHLGVIFLANLELGYMTPPVGLNLFLASYRFKISMVKLYWSVLPFFLIRLVIVLIITYLPILSTWLPSLVKKFLS